MLADVTSKKSFGSKERLFDDVVLEENENSMVLQECLTDLLNFKDLTENVEKLIKLSEIGKIDYDSPAFDSFYRILLDSSSEANLEPSLALIRMFTEKISTHKKERPSDFHLAAIASRYPHPNAILALVNIANVSLTYAECVYEAISHVDVMSFVDRIISIIENAPEDVYHHIKLLAVFCTYKKLVPEFQDLFSFIISKMSSLPSVTLEQAFNLLTVLIHGDTETSKLVYEDSNLPTVFMNCCSGPAGLLAGMKFAKEIIALHDQPIEFYESSRVEMIIKFAMRHRHHPSMIQACLCLSNLASTGVDGVEVIIQSKILDNLLDMHEEVPYKVWIQVIVLFSDCILESNFDQMKQIVTEERLKFLVEAYNEIDDQRVENVTSIQKSIYTVSDAIGRGIISVSSLNLFLQDFEIEDDECLKNLIESIEYSLE